MSWRRSSLPYAINLRQTMRAYMAPLVNLPSLILASPWSSEWATTLTVAGLIRPCIHSALGFRQETSELLHASTKAMSETPYSRPCTRLDMHYTSRVSIQRSTALRLDAARLLECMRASPGYGNTW